jgi:hypothetical protein
MAGYTGCACCDTRRSREGHASARRLPGALRGAARVHTCAGQPARSLREERADGGLISRYLSATRLLPAAVAGIGAGNAYCPTN